MTSTGETAPDGITLIEAIRTLEEAGYTAQLGAEGGGVRCYTCQAVTPPGEVRVDRLCRTEGASDPADMIAVAAARCPRCGALGTLSLKYGPGATPEEAAVLTDIDDRDRRRAAAGEIG